MKRLGISDLLEFRIGLDAVLKSNEKPSQSGHFKNHLKVAISKWPISDSDDLNDKDEGYTIPSQIKVPPRIAPQAKISPDWPQKQNYIPCFIRAFCPARYFSRFEKVCYCPIFSEKGVARSQKKVLLLS